MWMNGVDCATYIGAPLKALHTTPDLPHPSALDVVGLISGIAEAVFSRCLHGTSYENSAHDKRNPVKRLFMFDLRELWTPNLLYSLLQEQA
jgi:hypothetical protein